MCVFYCSLILSMFVFAVDKLESFLKQFPDLPNAFLIGGPADIFVIELADQVKFEILSPVHMLPGRSLS